MKHSNSKKMETAIKGFYAVFGRKNFQSSFHLSLSYKVFISNLL